MQPYAVGPHACQWLSHAYHVPRPSSCMHRVESFANKRQRGGVAAATAGDSEDSEDDGYRHRSAREPVPLPEHENPETWQRWLEMNRCACSMHVCVHVCVHVRLWLRACVRACVLCARSLPCFTVLCPMPVVPQGGCAQAPGGRLPRPPLLGPRWVPGCTPQGGHLGPRWVPGCTPQGGHLGWGGLGLGRVAAVCVRIGSPTPPALNSTPASRSAGAPAPRPTPPPPLPPHLAPQS